MIAINKHSANPKIWSVEMPNAPNSNRYAQAKKQEKNEKFATRKYNNGKPHRIPSVTARILFVQ